MPIRIRSNDDEDEDEDDDTPLDDLGLDDEPGDDWDDGPDLGPDERDADLMDGSWEERYYRGEGRGIDWTQVGVALGLLVLLGFAVSLILGLR